MFFIKRHTGDDYKYKWQTTNELQNYKHMEIGKLMIKYVILLITIISINTGVYAQTKTIELLQENRSLEQFSSIEVGGNFNVKIIQSDEYSILVEAQETHINNILTNIFNEVLSVEYSGLRKPSNLFVTIYVPDLERIRLTGTAELLNEGVFEDSLLKLSAEGAAKITLNLNVKELYTKASGAAEIILTGNVEKHNITAIGDAIIDADELESLYANVNARNNSFVDLYAIEELVMESYSDSKISYKGQPKVITKTRPVVSNRSGRYNRPDYRNRFEFRNDRDHDTRINFGSINVEVSDDRDSTVVIIGRHKFLVDEWGNARYSKIYRNRFNGHWGGIDIGINGYLTPEHNMDYPEDYEFLDLRLGKSVRFDLNLFEQNVSLSKNNKWGLITGLGFEFRNYRFDRKVSLSSTEEEIKGYYIDGVGVSKSKLAVTYLNIPLIFEFQTNAYGENDSFHIGAGVIMGLRLRSHTKIKFSEKNVDYDLIDPVTDEVYDTRTVTDIKAKNHDAFHLNPIKMDATVRIGWGWINLYATYSFSTLFKSGEGPELYPFSVGISLLRW